MLSVNQGEIQAWCPEAAYHLSSYQWQYHTYLCYPKQLSPNCCYTGVTYFFTNIHYLIHCHEIQFSQILTYPISFPFFFFAPPSTFLVLSSTSASDSISSGAIRYLFFLSGGSSLFLHTSVRVFISLTIRVFSPVRQDRNTIHKQTIRVNQSQAVPRATSHRAAVTPRILQTTCGWLVSTSLSCRSRSSFSRPSPCLAGRSLELLLLGCPT